MSDSPKGLTAVRIKADENLITARRQKFKELRSEKQDRNTRDIEKGEVDIEKDNEKIFVQEAFEQEILKADSQSGIINRIRCTPIAPITARIGIPLRMYLMPHAEFSKLPGKKDEAAGHENLAAWMLPHSIDEELKLGSLDSLIRRSPWSKWKKPGQVYVAKDDGHEINEGLVKAILLRVCSIQNN